MIDGVRMSVSSHSNSQSKSIRKEEMHRPESGEKKDVKVLVSEEECEIINMGGYRPELDANAADDDEPYKPSQISHPLL